MAGVALGDIDLHFARQALHFRAMDLHFAWQVWHLETWTFTLPGRHGTYGTGLPRMSAWFPFDAVVAAAVGVAGVALGDIDVRLAWQAWHLVTSMLQVTPSFTHNFATHNSSHTIFKMIDPPPSPLSFLLSPCRFNHFF